MSRLRIGFWLAGLSAALVLSSLTSFGPEFRQLAPIGLLLIWALIGLAIEVGIAVRAVSSTPTERAPACARPADGRVEVVEVSGVRIDPNPRDPRFHRFLELTAWQPDTTGDPASGRVNPPLLGRVVVFSVFVGRDGRGWSEAEIAEAHASLIRAGTWIEREAIRWGAPVNVDLADAYFLTEDDGSEEVTIEFGPDGDHEGPFEAKAAVRALAGFSRAASRLGLVDAAAMTARIGPRVEADVRIWLLHQRRAGRSFAVPTAESDLPGVALAVCYAREESLPEPLIGRPYADPITYVHELLHLFGASDKYDVTLDSFPARSVTERDVMRLDETSLSRMRIDLLTAAEIGWAPPSRGAKKSPPRSGRDRGGRGH